MLAHLAQNAGSHINLLTWARTGVKIPQYASHAARAAAIEAVSMVALARGSAGHASCRSPPQTRRSAAAQSAARHLADLKDSAARLTAAVRDLPRERWSAPVEGMRPPAHPAWYLLARRLR